RLRSGGRRARAIAAGSRIAKARDTARWDAPPRHDGRRSDGAHVVGALLGQDGTRDRARRARLLGTSGDRRRSRAVCRRAEQGERPQEQPSRWKGLTSLGGGSTVVSSPAAWEVMKGGDGSRNAQERAE